MGLDDQSLSGNESDPFNSFPDVNTYTGEDDGKGSRATNALDFAGVNCRTSFPVRSYPHLSSANSSASQNDNINAHSSSEGSQVFHTPTPTKSSSETRMPESSSESQISADERKQVGNTQAHLQSSPAAGMPSTHEKSANSATIPSKNQIAKNDDDEIHHSSEDSDPPTQHLRTRRLGTIQPDKSDDFGPPYSLPQGNLLTSRSGGRLRPPSGPLLPTKRAKSSSNRGNTVISSDSDVPRAPSSKSHRSSSTTQAATLQVSPNIRSSKREEIEGSTQFMERPATIHTKVTRITTGAQPSAKRSIAQNRKQLMPNKTTTSSKAKPVYPTPSINLTTPITPQRIDTHFDQGLQKSQDFEAACGEPNLASTYAEKRAAPRAKFGLEDIVGDKKASDKGRCSLNNTAPGKTSKKRGLTIGGTKLPDFHNAMRLSFYPTALGIDPRTTLGLHINPHATIENHVPFIVRRPSNPTILEGSHSPSRTSVHDGEQDEDQGDDQHEDQSEER